MANRAEHQNFLSGISKDLLIYHDLRMRGLIEQCEDPAWDVKIQRKYFLEPGDVAPKFREVHWNRGKGGMLNDSDRCGQLANKSRKMQYAIRAVIRVNP